jgi:hypothetical protein
MGLFNLNFETHKIKRYFIMKEIKLEIRIKESNISKIFQQELVLKIEE